MSETDGLPAQGTNQQTPRAPRYLFSRTGIFVYDLVVIAVLIAIGVLYFEFSIAKMLDAIILHRLALTLEAAWFGALGGVIISLKGVYEHSSGTQGWDASYNLWHLGRPVSGAIAGLMTVILLMVINSGGNSDVNLSTPVVYAAAFIFGTQERRFFNLLYEVARLVVQVPEEAKAGLVLNDVQPSEGSAGSVIVITGQGIEADATVKLGTATVEKLLVSRDGTTAAGIIPAQPAGAGTVDVSVINSGGKSATLAAKFKFTG
jgi:IPT/TIG domain